MDRLLKSIRITASNTLLAFIGSLIVNCFVYNIFQPYVPNNYTNAAKGKILQYFFEYMHGQPGKTLFTINLALLCAFVFLCLLYLFLHRFFHRKI